MKIIVIGSVAAGTSVAAKARRNSEDNEIIIYDRDFDISYSGCGLPYFIGEDYITRDDLTPRDPQWFMKRFNMEVKTGHEVTAVDFENREITVFDSVTGVEFKDNYDRLVIATGAVPVRPDIKGIESGNVFVLKRVSDADRIINHMTGTGLGNAVIVGGGFIGLEMAESLFKRGFDVSVVERQNHVMPSMDSDIAVYIENYIKEKKIKLYAGQTVMRILKDGKRVLLSGGGELESDIIIMAAGIRPETELFKDSILETGEFGGILVNDKMETNIPGVYAAGDCCETRCLITGRSIYRPLGSTANKMGRIAGDVITGGNLRFRGILGTSIFKVFGLAAAQTGLTENEALKLGYDVEVIHNIKENISKYFRESSEMISKALADRNSGRIIGAQIVGEGGVDKRIDVIATAVTFGARAEDLFHLDLAYAPPFSTTKDPVMYTGMILDNAINRNIRIITPKKLGGLIMSGEPVKVIDVRSEADYTKGHIRGAVHIPLAEIRNRISEIDKSSMTVTHCNKGTSGNAAQNILLNSGFKEVYNISGGYNNFAVQHPELTEK